MESEHACKVNLHCGTEKVLFNSQCLIVKRQRHSETLVAQLKPRKVIYTTEMKHGIDEEPKVAIQYST